MCIRKLRKDNRGAALVYVIVAAALIITLGAATTATAFVNLQTTQVKEQSTDNFYSADTVMNAVVSGLESDISKAYELAYTEMVTKLNLYDDGNIVELRKAFCDAFLRNMDVILNDDSGSYAFMYDISRLQDYVQHVYGSDVSYTINALNGNNYIDVYGLEEELGDNDEEQCVILRNLHVTYEDDNGYYDEIITDVKITIPEPDFDVLEDDPVWRELIVENGIEVLPGKGLKISGNAYINEREGGSTDEKYQNNVLLVDKNSSFEIISPDEVILGGKIVTENATKLTIQGASEQASANDVYTENFDIGKHSEVFVSGRTYVDDDFEVNGMNSEVKLAGAYYGYSQSSDNVDKSSSININGTKTTFDISELETLMLAGTSFIKTTADNETLVEAPYENVKDLQTGEAFSVKSNQIAYLVDDNEFTTATVNTTVKDFVSNPMSYAQYNKMLTSNGGLETLTERILVTELSYGKSYDQYNAKILPVFSGRDQGTVYLYLQFDDVNNAADYFTDVIHGDTLLSQRLRTYAAQYLSMLKINESTNLLVNENYIDPSVAVYTSDTLPFIKKDATGSYVDGLGYKEPGLDEAAMVNRMGVASHKYWDDGLRTGVGKKYNILYEKTINAAKLTEFIAGATSEAAYQDHHTNNERKIVKGESGDIVGVILTGTTGHQAVLIDNKNSEAYELETGSGLVICSGDIHVTGDWVGTIICGGRMYCTEGSKDRPLEITYDTKPIISVSSLYFTQQLAEDEVSMMVQNVFKGRENIEVNDATEGHGDDEDMVSNAISFINWNRY